MMYKAQFKVKGGKKGRARGKCKDKTEAHLRENVNWRIGALDRRRQSRIVRENAVEPEEVL